MEINFDDTSPLCILAVPDEILVKILDFCSFRSMPSLCSSSKRFNNIIDWNMKRFMAVSYLERARQREVPKIKERLANGLIKAAILLDSPAHLEFFMKINADKSLNDAISELTPVVRKQEVYVSKSKSAQPNPFNENFIDNMVSGGLVNLYRWFVQAWETLWPGIRRRKHSQSFQVYWMRLLHALYTNYNANTADYQRIYPLIIEQLEIYSDMLIRLLLSDIDSLFIGVFVNKTLSSLLNHSKTVYLAFLNKLRSESNLKIDFFNASPHFIEEEDKSIHIGFQKLMMLTPLEASFYSGVGTDLMMKIVPKAHYGAVLAALFVRANPPDRDVPQLLELGAGVNALLPKPFSKFLGQDPIIESALGASVFLPRTQRHWRIEWLLSNGAKFSELEKEFILKEDKPLFNKILAVTLLQPKYNMLLNQYNNPPIEKLTQASVYYSPEGRISFKSDKTFRYERNPRKVYLGIYTVVGSKVSCKSVEEVVEVYRNSYSSDTEKQSCSEEFNFIVYKTAFDGVSFKLLKDWQILAGAANTKSYLTFFDMYWDFNFNK